MPRLVSRAATSHLMMAPSAETDARGGNDGGAGDAGGGTPAPEGGTGPARGAEVQAAEDGDGGGTPPPTGEGDGTAAEDEEGTADANAGGDAAPEEEEPAGAPPEASSPTKKRAAEASSSPARPVTKKKKTGDEDEDEDEGKSSGGDDPTTTVPPPVGMLLLPAGPADSAWMAQQAVRTANGGDPTAQHQLAAVRRQLATAHANNKNLLQRLSAANRQMTALQEKHRVLQGGTKPQAKAIAKLTKQNESLERQLKECKARLKEARDGEDRAERKGRTDVRALEEKLRKQTARTQRETEKWQRAKKELKDYKKTVQFNQTTKLQLPGDEGLPKTKNDQKWHDKYELLKRFKERHGHCNCTNLFPGKEDYPGLPNWVQSQRTAFTRLKAGRKTTITPLRIKFLNDVGFDWQPMGQDYIGFDQRIPQLQAFKDEYGHTNVQQQYKGVQGLGNWVLSMRRNYREGRLPQERIDILEAMGFQWRLRVVKVPGGRNNARRAAAAAQEQRREHQHHQHQHHPDGMWNQGQERAPDVEHYEGM